MAVSKKIGERTASIKPQEDIGVQEKTDKISDAELIGVVIHRYGVSTGLKARSKQLMREVNEHENTQKIKRYLSEVRNSENKLINLDLSAEERKDLRDQVMKQKEEVSMMKATRYIETDETRVVRNELKDVLRWIDEDKIEPEVAKRGMKPIETADKTDLAQAHKYQEMIKQNEKAKK